MNAARQNHVCDQCNRKPELCARRDGAGLRALYWCHTCEKPAFGGDSFVRVSPEYLATLKVVSVTERQGRLF